MGVTEQARHRLYEYFEETMGEERAATMMELLPPVGWGDVATKAGVHAEIAAVKAELQQFEQRIEQRIERKLVTKAEFERGLRTLLGGVIVTNIAVLGLAVGAATAIVR